MKRLAFLALALALPAIVMTGRLAAAGPPEPPNAVEVKIDNFSFGPTQLKVAVGTTVTRALESFCSPEGEITPGVNYSSLFIYPPYRFRTVGGMVTNFHLPQSTLLMLVSAFAGKDLVMRAYQEAVELKYRFYSYGDAMLIL